MTVITCLDFVASVVKRQIDLISGVEIVRLTDSNVGSYKAGSLLFVLAVTKATSLCEGVQHE
jgi:hypothetical protein